MSVRDDIFASKRRRLTREKVEFMGITVWAWELTASQRSELEGHRYSFSSKGQAKFDTKYERALGVLFGCRESDADDAPRVFGDGDANNINELPAIEVDRVYDVIARLSGIRSADAEDAKKNSGTTPTGASSSDSRTGADGQASNGALSSSPQAS
jgi:hypothetical protein